MYHSTVRVEGVKGLPDEALRKAVSDFEKQRLKEQKALWKSDQALSQLRTEYLTHFHSLIGEDNLV